MGYSNWAQVPLAEPDAILGITVNYKKDQSPNKINLGVGAYRDDTGKPVVLNCVKKAESLLVSQKLDKEYLPITGSDSFVQAAIELAYGLSSKELESQGKYIAATQSLSGTGALRIGSEFLQRFYPSKNILIPKPSWSNHRSIFSAFNISFYKYYDEKTKGLDILGLLSHLKSAPDGSVVLLHVCAHNPTGVDPTPDQWGEILNVVKMKKFFCFFDMAYQGFASGDCDRDAFSLRLFLKEGVSFCLAQSFAKNMGLYGERIGTFSIVTSSAQEREAVLSQIRLVIRPLYSNPPISGARIVSTILRDSALRNEWAAEVKTMADRIIDMRALLKKNLVDLGSRINWDHITDQIGMFCFSGLNESQVNRLSKEFHIYLTKDGRISISGITSGNVKYLAEAIHAVTSTHNKSNI